MWRITAIVLLFPTLCLAEGPQKTSNSGFVPMPGVEYFCTDSQGSRHELGEIMRLSPSSCQQFLAKCDMSLNNSMWRQIQEGCPAASLDRSVLDRLEGFQPT